MENKSKLNKVMLIVFILALFVGLVTLFIIINKGNIFGKRLVEISGEVVEKEITHSIEMTCDKKYLAIDTEDVANLLVTIDEKVYELKELNRNEKTSKEFDEIAEVPKEKKKYIPPMSHPWKLESFKRQMRLSHQKHVFA